MDVQKKIEELNQKTTGLSPENILREAYRSFGEGIIFASSLGEEDQIITDMISKVHSEIEIFTLDTGRLFQETYDLLEKTQKRYPMRFRVYSPDTEAVEDMVENHGINLFYESVENRKLCCGIRKIQPLRRALKNCEAWICGLRKSQSVTRSDIQVFEWDEGNQKIKINPLVDWTYEDVKLYIQKNNIDVNPLHEKGFISIGCASCTRAVKKGETDIRAGRWWWETPESKECGLHNNPKRQAYLNKKG